MNKQDLAQQILHDGMKIRHENVTLFYTKTKNPLEKVIVISSISKKVSKLATRRNRLRRQLRGLLYHHAKAVLKNYYWMWICKNDTLTEEIQQAFILDLKKLNAA